MRAKRNLQINLHKTKLDNSLILNVPVRYTNSLNVLLVVICKYIYPHRRNHFEMGSSIGLNVRDMGFRLTI